MRETVNGERINRKIKKVFTNSFSPVTKSTEWKTLDGKYVTPIKHDTIKETKEWVEQYKDQSHLVYGNNQFQYNYLEQINILMV